jgi:hypothetical protein
MAFELDTYTWTQPAHVVVDDDYWARKGTIPSVQVWALGQVVAVDSLLDAMLDPNRNTDGIFPELVFLIATPVIIHCRIFGGRRAIAMRLALVSRVFTTQISS